MRFGLSTHLFHGERLEPSALRDDSPRTASTSSKCSPRARTSTTTTRATSIEVRGWLDDLGLTGNSMHAPICESFTHGVWGRCVFERVRRSAARRDEAIAETRVAFDAARRLGARSLVVHLGLPRRRTIPPGDNDPGAVRRSLEALARRAADTGVRLALEVMPNDLSTPDALLDVLDDARARRRHLPRLRPRASDRRRARSRRGAVRPHHHDARARQHAASSTITSSRSTARSTGPRR